MSGNSEGSGKGAAHGAGKPVPGGNGRSSGEAGGVNGAGGGARAKPEWAGGLRQLYDSIVDEPLPDTFRDLLARLDSEDGGASGEAGSGKSGAGRSGDTC